MSYAAKTRKVSCHTIHNPICVDEITWWPFTAVKNLDRKGKYLTLQTFAFEAQKSLWKSTLQFAYFCKKIATIFCKLRTRAKCHCQQDLCVVAFKCPRAERKNERHQKDIRRKHQPTLIWRELRTRAAGFVSKYPPVLTADMGLLIQSRDPK